MPKPKKKFNFATINTTIIYSTNHLAMNEINNNKPAKKKRSIVFKIIKGILITLLFVVLLAGIMVGAALYVVFTPETTTKIVNHYANELLNADVHFDNIDITFLSTYPDFYLTINDGVVVSKTFKQASNPFPEAKDSLLSFAACNIKLDPIKYLQNKDLEINNIELKNINAYVYTDTNGNANWQIFPPSEEDTTTSDFVLNDYLHSAAIENIEVTSGKIIYNDYASDLYAKINKTKINLSGNFLDPDATLLFSMDLDKINFKTDSIVFAKDLNIKFTTTLAANLDSMGIDLAQAALSINDIAFDMEGYVAMPDTSRIKVDARLHASVPAIDVAKKMVPAVLVPIINTMDATGSLDIDAEVKGLYTQNTYPTLSASLLLNDASFKHESIDFWINDIQLNANAFVDLNKAQPSYADIKNFSLKSVCANLDANAYASNLLGDPRVKARLATDVDITNTLQYFPVIDGMDIKGKTDVKVNIDTKLSSITNQQWEKVNADAQVILDKISVDSPQDTMHIQFPKATITLQTNDTNDTLYADKYLADVDLKIDSLILNYASLADGTIGKVDLHTLLSPEYDYKTMTAYANIMLTNANLTMLKSMYYNSGETHLQLSMQPNSDALLSPSLACSIRTKGTNFDADSMAIDFSNMNIALNLKPLQAADTYRNLDTEELIKYLTDTFTDTTLTQNSDMLQVIIDRWKVGIDFNINSVEANMAMLNYPVSIPVLKLALDGNDLKLKNFIMSAKNSDLQLSGTISDVAKALTGKEKLTGNLTLKSNNLNINELMNVMVVTENTTDSLTPAPDTVVQMSVIEIPENINLSLRTDIKHALYGKANFKEINGDVVLKNQSVLLDNLNFASDLGAMNITLLYKAINQAKADFSAELKIDKLNINTLTTKLPEVDTMLPMLRSFEGLISTDIIAVGEFDSTLSINMPSLVASCYIRGDSLVLLDNKTFRKFSKLLLFENKDRNLIDSLAVEILMRQQIISFMPFIFKMDRYQVGITGTQYMNMDFDYNVSVLKWPLGIKMLVKYGGNMNDIDNAKLKIKLAEKKYSKEYERTGTFSAIRKQWKNIIIKKRKDLLEE